MDGDPGCRVAWQLGGWVRPPLGNDVGGWCAVEPIPETAEVLGELAKQGDPELVAWVLELGLIAKRIVPATVGLSPRCSRTV
jgi:hypothetical protein